MAYQSFVTNAGSPDSKKCGPGKLRVQRRAYTTSAGTKVAATKFCAADRGKPGRGPKTIPTPRKGSLGGPGYTSRPASARHRLLLEHQAKHGYASTISALQSRINLGRRTMSAKALLVLEQDKRWLQRLHKKERNMAKKKTKKKTSKRRSKKKTAKKKTTKRRTKKKTTKRRTKKKTKKKASKRRCKRPKGTKKKRSRYAKTTATGKKKKTRSRAAKKLAVSGWCRNFNDLSVPDSEL